MSTSDVPGSWRSLLIDIAFAKDYGFVYQLTGSPVDENPVLERLLPSLLYIKAVAILEYGLSEALASRDLPVPFKLIQKIDDLAAAKAISNATKLHSLRGVRNSIAHDPSGSVKWKDLEDDAETINETLKELGFVGDLPKIECEAIQEAAKPSTDPNFGLEQEYKLQLKQASKVIAEITWKSYFE